MQSRWSIGTNLFPHVLYQMRNFRSWKKDKRKVKTIPHRSRGTFIAIFVSNSNIFMITSANKCPWLKTRWGVWRRTKETPNCHPAAPLYQHFPLIYSLTSTDHSYHPIEFVKCIKNVWVRNSPGQSDDNGTCLGFRCLCFCCRCLCYGCLCCCCLCCCCLCCHCLFCRCLCCGCLH